MEDQSETTPRRERLDSSPFSYMWIQAIWHRYIYSQTNSSDYTSWLNPAVRHVSSRGSDLFKSEIKSRTNWSVCKIDLRGYLEQKCKRSLQSWITIYSVNYSMLQSILQIRFSLTTEWRRFAAHETQWTATQNTTAASVSMIDLCPIRCRYSSCGRRDSPPCSDCYKIRRSNLIQ